MLNRKYKNMQIDTALKIVKSAVTLSANAGTINTPAGRITTGSLVTAAGASQALTITNPLVGPNDTILIQQTAGTNTTRAFTIVPVPAAGSFVATVYNTSASALNGTIIFDYVIIKG